MLSFIRLSKRQKNKKSSPPSCLSCSKCRSFPCRAFKRAASSNTMQKARSQNHAFSQSSQFFHVRQPVIRAPCTQNAKMYHVAHVPRTSLYPTIVVANAVRLSQRASLDTFVFVASATCTRNTHQRRRRARIPLPSKSPQSSCSEGGVIGRCQEWKSCRVQ